jgi:hypothetical protein
VKMMTNVNASQAPPMPNVLTDSGLNMITTDPGVCHKGPDVHPA